MTRVPEGKTPDQYRRELIEKEKRIIARKERKRARLERKLCRLQIAGGSAAGIGDLQADIYHLRGEIREHHEEIYDLWGSSWIPSF